MVDIVHKSVLQRHVLELLAPSREDAVFIDATVGEGGHSESFLEQHPLLRVVGLDIDSVILEVATARLSRFEQRFSSYNIWFNQFFADYPADLPRPHRVLLDLGISIFHYERSGRGFSFRGDEPIDMRLNEELETSAHNIVNEYPEEELATLFFEFGEERYSRRIAKRIVREREKHTIDRSVDLADIVSAAVPAEYRHGRLHPATRTFQALRIAVNGELVRLEQALAFALHNLEIGGRIGVISFHSLEDRIVKRFFKEKSRTCTCPPEWPVCKCDGQAIVKLVTKRPVRATEQEIDENPPSRSAKFRVIEKINEEEM
jgi:16S rRNA (cytosine1402-N4)-methyltransferase